jgi:hypothetical protein
MEALLSVDRAFYVNNDYASEVEAYQVSQNMTPAARRLKVDSYNTVKRTKP